MAGSGGRAGASSGGTAGSGGNVDACAKERCDGHGSCVVKRGVPICRCAGGYERPEGDPLSCEDLDECATNNGGCDPLTTCTNTSGSRACGACPAGYSGDGEGGCVPRPCTGAPGQQCPCIKVAPDGDDDAGSESRGLTPFATVQTAVDFAAAHPEIATNVCVAAGPSCGAGHAYPGPTGQDLTMRNGIGVYGAYESTGWARCANSTTTLVPNTESGVLFGSEVEKVTALDGFTVKMLDASTTTGITVDGAGGALVNAVVVTDAGILQATSRYGVRVLSGGEATLTQSEVRLLSGLGGGAVGVRAELSRVTLSECTVSAHIRGAPVAGIQLLDSPASLVGDSTVTFTRNASSDGDFSAVGVQIVGDAEGVDVDGMSIVGTAGDASTGIELAGTGHVSIADNAITLGARGSTIDGIGVSGEDVLIENNQVLVDVAGPRTTNLPTDATAIRCTGACAVRSNVVRVEHTASTVGLAGTSTGVWCRGCIEVSANDAHLLTGIPPYSLSGIASTVYEVIGLDLGASDVLVDRNVVDLGWADVAVGVAASGARIQNNDIVGRSAPTDPPGAPGTIDYPISSYGIRAGSDTDIHSNTLRKGICTGDDLAVLLIGPGARLRNNILGSCGYDVREINAYSAPAVIQNNDFLGPAYLDGASGLLTTIASINGLPGASANLSADPQFMSGIRLGPASLCIDAGTPLGAPEYDIYGNPRGATPDVGAHEWGDAGQPCLGVTCSGHGQCRRVGYDAVCTCATGYESPAGDPTICEDVDECAIGNGGCDPLTLCTNTDGGRACGACPPGYGGDGELGCYPTIDCDVNPCENGGTCSVVDGTQVCDCPPGITGPRCDTPFVMLAGRGEAMCGIRTDGTLACWGSGSIYPPEGTYLDVSFGCAVRTDGTLACWGPNDLDQANPPPGTFQSVASGSTHACGIRTDGTLACWGGADSGRTSPPSGAFQLVASGYAHSCAIDLNGTMACWGYNSDGQANAPSGTFQGVATGFRHSCGLQANGDVVCWGRDTSSHAGPYVQVEASRTSTCARRADGTIDCWGSGSAVSSLPSGTFSTFAMNESEGCGLRADLSVSCWGQTSTIWGSPPGGAYRTVHSNWEPCAIGFDGQIECYGFGSVPVGVFEHVASTQAFRCATTASGDLSCWSGYGPPTPLGGTYTALAATIFRVSPSVNQVCGLLDTGAVNCWAYSSGSFHAELRNGLYQAISGDCGVHTDGSLECWSDGTGSSPPAGSYLGVGSGYTHACALRTDGEIVCWGTGPGATATPPAGPFDSVVSGGNHNCALRPDGSVQCWGDDTDRQTEVPPYRFLAISAGANHTCGVRSDYELSCWGNLVR